jgi:hypothetical protein
MTFRSNESTDIASDSACVEVGEVKMKGMSPRTASSDRV